jgi:hypothetical protein
MKGKFMRGSKLLLGLFVGTQGRRERDEFKAGSWRTRTPETAPWLLRRCSALLIAGSLTVLALNQASATVAVTGASSGSSISADTAATALLPAWTTLGPITMTEKNKGDFAAGANVTLVLKVPAGFQLNTTATPSIVATPGANITAAAIVVTDPSTLTVTLTVAGTSALDTLTIGGTPGIQVRPTAGAPLAAGNHIYRPSTGGGTATISGITTSTDGSNGSNFGNLTEVGGIVTQLGFATQPGNASAGAPFGTQPVIKSFDQFGNNSTNGLPATSLVNVSLASGVGPLQGTASVNLGMSGGKGTATFSGLRLDVTGNDKQLLASSTTGLANSSSSVFTVNPGSPSQVTISPQPSSSAVAGIVFPQQPAVWVRDAFNNMCNTSVTAARAGGTGNLQGTMTMSAVNGVATYTNLSSPSVGNITISFTSGSASATSGTITVGPGSFSQLQVLLPGQKAAPGTASGKTGTPTAQTAGAAFNGVIVNAVDANWNVITTVTDTIHLNASDATAGLPADISLVGGTATFNGVLFKAAGNQSITATDLNDTTMLGTSSPLWVNAGPFTKIQLLMPGEAAAAGSLSGKAGAPTAQTAGTPFSVRVNGVDANWNVVTNATGSSYTMGITSTDPNAALPASANLASGTQTFAVTFKTPGTATVTATDLDKTTLTSTSPTTTINSGGFAKLQLLMPGETAAPGTSTGKKGTPTAQTVGTPFVITVNAVDSNWNLINTVNDTANITSSDANASLPPAAALSGGTGTFSVTLNTIGSATVTASDLTDATKLANTSSATSVNVGPFVKLQLLMPGENAAPGTLTGKTGSPTPQTAGTSFKVTVNAVDAKWNPISTAKDSIGITSSDLNAVLPSTAPLNSGTKSFSITPKTSGNIIITAMDLTDATKLPNAGTATPVATAAFVKLQLLMPGETAAPGTSSGKTGIPTSQTAGQAFNAIVNAVDANWNVVNTNDVVHLASTNSGAAMPSNAALAAGTKTFPITFNAGGAVTVTASDVTHSGILNNTSPAFTVVKVDQTISFGSLSDVTYGVTPLALSATATSGLTVSFAVLSGPATLSGNNLSITGVGTVKVRASQSGNSIYNAASNVDQSFNVMPAILTVKADDKTRVFGQPNPPLTVSFSGFTNGDTAQVLLGSPVLSTSAGTYSTIDQYPITIAQGNLSSANYTFSLKNGTLTVTLPPPGMQPAVAIHDSELTRALATLPASGPTPTGLGTTGNQWWPTNWPYWLMPESVQEALRSDGTPFTVLSDAAVNAGLLLDQNGNPRYPIVISLASEAINDSEIALFTNYVAAGGCLFVGSSAFTRTVDGTPRGDFAFAAEMGVHMPTSSLQNWINDSYLTKLQNHRLVSHIPGGQLTWRMPLSADETQWGTSPHPTVPTNPHWIWNVQAVDAIPLAQGDASPYVLTKSYGKGQFIYDAAMQPLIGHGSYAPGMYSYGIFRKAIESAFDAAKTPVPKLSPWPYAYDAAMIVRHDLEDYQNEIAGVMASAQYEFSQGVKADYYFCTGTLREEMNNNPTVIAGLSNAVVLYQATIGSHNGGLPNPNNLSLALSDYDYWHWGPDEVLDIIPPGYADGKSYAFTSISNSFIDIEGWLAGTPNFGRSWVGCYFNSTREDSYDILAKLNTKTAGDQKLSPFPHWTVSTRTSGKRYPMISLPVSDWYLGTQIGQSMESGYSVQNVHDLVDFYYGLGALINLYGHTLSVPGYYPGYAGTLPQEYITYCMNSTLHPRLWAANAQGIYNWWLSRSAAQISTTVSTTGNMSTVTISISGASDPNTAVEVVLPSSIPVSLSSVSANSGPATYRLNGRTVKVQVGTTVNTVQISYMLLPQAQNDLFTVAANSNLSVPAPGVLANDSDPSGLANSQVELIANPVHGSLILTNNGGFSYVPNANFSGMDFFSYRINNGGQAVSAPATVMISVLPPSYLFLDDFARPTDNPGLLFPWTAAWGNWTVNSGMLLGGLDQTASYGFADLGNNWSDYAVEAQIQFPAGAFGGGLGGRVNSASGAHYAAWVYPEGSLGASAVLRLIKFQTWTTWAPIQEVNPLPNLGTGWHTLKLALHGNQLGVYLDGVQQVSATDAQGYASGGISADMWTYLTPYAMSIADVAVHSLVIDDAYATPLNTSLVVPSPGILANDTGVQTSSLTVTGMTLPANGTLIWNPDGGFTYTPNSGYVGTDSFTYQTSDGTQPLGSATVTVTVGP